MAGQHRYHHRAVDRPVVSPPRLIQPVEGRSRVPCSIGISMSARLAGTVTPQSVATTSAAAGDPAGVTEHRSERYLTLGMLEEP
jgi:hypothetical protein